MLTTTPQNRNRLIAGVAVLIAFLTIIVYLSSRSQLSKGKTSVVGSRVPVFALPYCTVDQSRLCVVSFGQVVNGPMQVDFLAPSADSAELVLKIKNNEVESIYDCQHLEESPEHIYCTGNVQPPGAILQLSLLSKQNDTLLAKGTFSLIGVALLTPEVLIEESGNKLSPQLGFRIPEASRRSPLLSHSTPSYPNPSYP